MNSSVPPARRIASNLLWTPEGVVRAPWVELGPDGRVRARGVWSEADRMAGTEFYAGLLVLGFPEEFRAAFERLCAAPEVPLAQSLPELVSERGRAVVLSGLDYETLRLTPRARIRAL